MIKISESLPNLIVKDKRTIEEKQSSLNKIGIKISINRSNDCENVCILGRMKDKYRELKVV